MRTLHSRAARRKYRAFILGACSRAAAPPAPEAPGMGFNSTLDVLMAMEMPVTIRFGITRMLLRELLRLDAGSVIEFPRSPSEPVDVIVNRRVVARGEIVAFQGNYGVRITEVCRAPAACKGKKGK